MEATADLRRPHLWTGKFLKRMKPLPLRSSAHMERRKEAIVGRGKVEGEMAVNGIEEERKASAAAESSASSDRENGCVQLSGCSLYVDGCQSVGPVTAWGKRRSRGLVDHRGVGVDQRF